MDTPHTPSGPHKRPFSGEKRPFGQKPFGAQRPPFGSKFDSKPGFAKPRFDDRTPYAKPSFGGKSFGAQSFSRTPQAPRTRTMENSTSWGKVADWYDTHLSGDDTYHEQVILPNLVRLVGPRAGLRVADLGAGQGYFSLAFAKAGATVLISDISKELIDVAKKHALDAGLPADRCTFLVSPANLISSVQSESFDVATIVLALQNIKELHATVAELARIITQNGRIYIVLNHPAFRIPKRSSWQYDPRNEQQYRRIDGYLSERSSKIDMHPGKTAIGQGGIETISFHRPLQVYAKAFAAAGLAITGIEEWISHRESEKGPRKETEDSCRREFPLFMCIELRKGFRAPKE